LSRERFLGEETRRRKKKLLLRERTSEKEEEEEGRPPGEGTSEEEKGKLPENASRKRKVKRGGAATARSKVPFKERNSREKDEGSSAPEGSCEVSQGREAAQGGASRETDSLFSTGPGTEEENRTPLLNRQRKKKLPFGGVLQIKRRLVALQKKERSGWEQKEKSGDPERRNWERRKRN